MAGVQDISIVAPAAQLPLDGTMQLTATVRGADGEPLPDRAIYWSSGTPDVAEVSATGVVTPRAVGHAQIAASSEGRSAVVELDVVRKQARTVELALARQQIAAGDTITLAVSARAGDGEPVTGVAPALASTDPAIAAVIADGRVVGVAPGSASIVATVDGVADTTGVVVVPAPVATVVVEPAEFQLSVGQQLPLRVTLRDRAGRVLTGRAVRYASSSSAASVRADGTVQALATGDAVITATSEGVSGTARARILPLGPARLGVSPASVASLTVGATVTLVATVYDVRGAALPGRTIRWTSTAPGRATVNSRGVVTGVAPGGATIVAEADGLTASVGVSVVPVPVARVVVSPADLSLEVGQTGQLTAAPQSASGAALQGRAVTWSSSAPAVASVTSTGEVRALAEGTAIITATAEGQSGTAGVTVTTPPPPEPPPPPPGPPGAPVRMEMVSGDDQSGPTNRELPEPLVARITDADGRGVPNVTVLWTTGGDGEVSPVFGVTDADGLVSARWTLGNRDGRQTAQLRAPLLPTVTFTAQARD